jgi:hypothetical protein
MRAGAKQVEAEEVNTDYYLPSNLPYWIWKVAHHLSKYRGPFLPFMLQQVLRIFLGCCLPYRRIIENQLAIEQRHIATASRLKGI